MVQKRSSNLGRIQTLVLKQVANDLTGNRCALQAVTSVLQQAVKSNLARKRFSKPQACSVS